MMHGRYHLPRLQKKIPSRPLGTQNHVSKRELVEIGKEETWQSRNFESNKTKKPTPYLVTGIWKKKKKVPRMPSSNTEKLSPITTGIRKIQKQYFEFPPQVHKNLHHSTPEFGKYEQKYMTSSVQIYEN
jgi:hypothetical protein